MKDHNQEAGWYLWLWLPIKCNLSRRGPHVPRVAHCGVIKREHRANNLVRAFHALRRAARREGAKRVGV